MSKKTEKIEQRKEVFESNGVVFSLEKGEDCLYLVANKERVVQIFDGQLVVLDANGVTGLKQNSSGRILIK